ncbi:MAG: hypothetical protein A2W93_06975 [Bacteroidetes bacterium GWF2_43_63]|nr:MAG: hypothetical protein A2W94_09905 [Bacteroidetes bacterium GWE2_42_42]OFY53787.1 MAG: hypothetical protein A2W93_06975 [Bacteroidetes bacterium GWF2_43_63]
MKTKIILAAMVVITLALQSCFHPYRIEGNCNVITVHRNTGQFTAVESSGSLDVKIIRDTACFVEIEGEENLIPYIDTEVHDGTLIIDVAHRRNLDPNYPIVVYVHVPDLESIELSGSGSIESDSLSAQHMDVRLSGSGDISLQLVANTVDATISGSGDINLSGSATSADFKISGSGDIHAYTFPVSECMADISGSGSMYLTVSDLLDVVISGSGNVHYYGTAAVSVNVLGSGQVIHH